MPTNQDQLDQGPPPIDPNVDPATLPTEDQTRYGDAFTALLGTRGAAEAMFATALLRVPVEVTGLAVAGSTVSLSTNGAVIAIQATVGTLTGGLTPVLSAPASGEVGVSYSGTYEPTLTFNALDAVTQCSVSQLQIPSEFIEMLQASNPA